MDYEQARYDIDVIDVRDHMTTRKVMREMLDELEALRLRFEVLEQTPLTRDGFAAAALAGLRRADFPTAAQMSRAAYEIADAMFAARRDDEVASQPVSPVSPHAFQLDVDATNKTNGKYRICKCGFSEQYNIHVQQ